MTRAAEAQSWFNGPDLVELTSHIDPHLYVAVCARIADEIHAMLRAAEKHVNAIAGPRGSNVTRRIAADQGHNDDLDLLPLKVIDGGQKQAFCQLLSL